MTEGQAGSQQAIELAQEPEFMQATVHAFDATTGSGSVITDQGVVIPFSSLAWQHSRLLTLRMGQRLQVSVSDEGSGTQVTALTLATFRL